MEPIFELETKRLVLKPINHEDWPLFERLHTTSEVMQFVSDADSAENIKNRFESRLGQWHKSMDKWLTLTMFEKHSGKKVGVTGLFPEWQPYQQAELGFLLSPEFQGLGYGKESTKVLIDFAFSQLKFHKLKATVTKGNEPSFNLLVNLGFVHEGTLRDNFKLNNQWYDDLKLGLLADEFFNQAPSVG